MLSFGYITNHILNFFSWRGDCISFSGLVLVLGRFGWWSWNSQQRNSSEPSNITGFCRTLWLLLFRAWCFPKYLHFHGQTLSVPCGSLDMVTYYKNIINIWKLFVSEVEFFFFFYFAVLEFVLWCMRVSLSWDIACSENQQNHSLLSICLKIWLHLRLLCGPQ